MDHDISSRGMTNWMKIEDSSKEKKHLCSMTLPRRRCSKWNNIA